MIYNQQTDEKLKRIHFCIQVVNPIIYSLLHPTNQYINEQLFVIIRGKKESDVFYEEV